MPTVKEDCEKIVSAGLEGGGATVYGRRVRSTDGETDWVFWKESGGMFFDDNDEEEWRYSRSEESSDVTQVCPPELFLLYPARIHPEFASWFRHALEEERRRRNSSPPSSDPIGGDPERKAYILRRWEKAIARSESATPEK